MNSRQARWLKFLQDFNYQLEHTSGSSNTIANLLSRHKDLNKGVNTEEPHILLPDHLFSNITNTHLQKTFLEDNEQMHWEILRKIHDSQAGGHSKIANTWELVRQHYKGPRLREFDKEYIKGSMSPEAWTNWISIATAIHNNRWNATTKLSPNQILLGYETKLIPTGTGESTNEATEWRLETMIEKRPAAIDAISVKN